jgi:hypothetical protein
VADQVKRETGSTRDAIRWGVLLAAVGTVGFRLPRLVHEFREWREAARFGDLSAADAWRTSLFADLSGVLLVLAVGLVVFYVLRAGRKAEQ